MTVSLLIATYNWPEALRLCLDSTLHQSVLPTEIIIADDGSGQQTQELIRSYQDKSPIPIIHVWHEDLGFRLTVIRNKAIAASTSDYLIQVDGDLILHRDFIKDHLRFAQPGTFVCGSRTMITAERSKELIDQRISRLSALQAGIRHRLNGMRCPLMGHLFYRTKSHNPMALRGCNMAFWRKDLLRVNGYNEEMLGWGREDNEIVCRLMNAGVRKRTLKFGGIVFHLHHSTQTRNRLNVNDEILAQTRQQMRTECLKGICQTFPSLTVIITTYNNEKDIAECIESVLAQDYPDLEIIVVNDGSTDSTPSIVKTYGSKVKLLNKENGGLSSARNYGLQCVNSEFVTFVDGDDTLAPDTYRQNLMAMALQPELDIVQYPILCEWKSDHELQRTPPSPYTLDDKRKILSLFLDETLSFSCCNKIFRMEALHHERFTEGMFYEDMDFLTRIFPHIRQLKLSNQGNYLYRCSQHSITRSANSYGKVKDYFTSLFTFLHVAQKNGVKHTLICRYLTIFLREPKYFIHLNLTNEQIDTLTLLSRGAGLSKRKLVWQGLTGQLSRRKLKALWLLSDGKLTKAFHARIH